MPAGVALLLLALLAGGCNRAPVEPFAQVTWTEDYAAALQRAQAEHKFLLLDLESSDSCAPCIAMDREVFNTQPFKDYADKNLVLVKVDFPQLQHQPEALMQQNIKLAINYNLKALPTVVLADSAGRELGKLEGYDFAGARTYIGKIEKVLATAKTAPAPTPAGN